MNYCRRLLDCDSATAINYDHKHNPPPPPTHTHTTPHPPRTSLHPSPTINPPIFDNSTRCKYDEYFQNIDILTEVTVAGKIFCVSQKHLPDLGFLFLIHENMERISLDKNRSLFLFKLNLHSLIFSLQ